MQYNKIIIFLDYCLPKWIFEKNLDLVKQEFSEQEIFVLDWLDYFDNFNSFDLKQAIDFFNSKIYNYIEPNDNILFVSCGLSSTILNLIPKTNIVFKNIYFSIILSQNYINPYTSNKPTYKTDKQTYLQRLKKEIYDLKKLNINIESSQYQKIFDWYSTHQTIIENIIEKISLYEFLNFLHKQEFKTLNDNDIFVFCDQDKIIEYNKSLKIFVDKKINSVIKINNVAHHCLLENIDFFIKIIKSCEEY